MKENSRSVAGRPLPPIKEENKNDGTILLFYQYKEPEWTVQEHKTVIKDVIKLGEECGITGRGRIAPEGLNCTLSGTPQGIRNFCLGLRRMDRLFMQTDFKLTDGIPKDKLFKSLSIRKTKELVAYGLPGDKAPSLSKFAGEHLEAEDYHKAMMDKDTVIVDVRNYYESSIGAFAPPPGGAELIDPKMRNSIEFPKWLSDPATQKKLDGKKVLMYCTGGIRCERATALLNQMSAAAPDQIKPKGVYELRGGIERYVKTFPQGGFWKGKNYLFDRRSEQTPGSKTEAQVEKETNSKCCLCRKKWTMYRGKFKCSQGLCGVPVIVCDGCKIQATEAPKTLICELCKAGYKAPQLMPDLVGMKRKAEGEVEPVDAGNDDNVTVEDETATVSNKKVKQQSDQGVYQDRLFVGRLPLTVTKTKLQEALGGAIKLIHWYTDRMTGAFYGSCIVQVEDVEVAKRAVTEFKDAMKIDNKKIRISYARVKDGDVWPPSNFVEREYPPVGT